MWVEYFSVIILNHRKHFTHDETMKLINLWGSENCLYNAQSDNYRDKNKRMNPITRIVNKGYLHGGKTTMLYLNLSGHDD